MLDLGGTYRTISPQETLDKIIPMLWDKFGISRVANITGLDDLGIPTYIAIRPDSKILTTAQGKGITHDLAKISAIMESIESWHAEHITSPNLFGSYREVKNQYHLVELEKLINGSYNIDSESLCNQQISWASGIELNSGREIYFPSSLIDLDSLALSTNRLGCFPASSNGLASGNSMNEAICHGIFEVIERHSCMVSKLTPPRYVDESTITATHIKTLLKKISHDTVKFKICDMTSENGVPTYSAVLFDLREMRELDFFMGSGAHLSSVVALSRAITEAIQCRLTMISGSRDDIFPSSYIFKRKFTKLKPKNLDLFKFNSIPFIEKPVPENFKSCIDELLQRLNKQGFNQVIVYDHTRSDLGIPVVHVIIPGMQFDWFKHKTQAYTPEFFFGSALRNAGE